MNKSFEWNNICFVVDGKPTSIISGEFHYFRVPKSAWRERLILLKESGANTVATYIPWIIHEPREKEILFDDIPERSLTDFLKLCCELDIMVIARPGPYAYSELWHDGLPFWLAQDYPETLAHGPKGEKHKTLFNASYLHPVFLEKARRYIRAVDEKIRPFLITNGGCIISVQADNEIGGIHVWRGYLDCNVEAMGFGKENGHYVRFLKEKYKSIELLNERYGSEYHDFTDVLPFENTPDDSTVEGKRFACDYRKFYKSTLEIYIKTLCSWFCEDGIDVGYCTNAGNPPFIPMLRDIPKQNEKYQFHMGVDHYYAGEDGNMTADKVVKYGASLDMLDALGLPASVWEMQSGAATCSPPILNEPLSCFYMTHIAFGMKGSNYYIFTGGPNFENTGTNTEIYDYHAPVSATGEVRPIYYAQKERNEYSNENPWLLTTPRCCDVQLGFDWELLEASSPGPWKRYSRDSIKLWRYNSALQLTLGLSARLFKYKDICGELDIDIPLIVACDDRMAKEKQELLVNFVERGGKLILTPVLPELDEDFLPCTILRDYLGVKSVELIEDGSPIILENAEKVYELKSKYTFNGFDGRVLGYSERGGEPIIEYKSFGKGAVVLMGAYYDYRQHCQMDMLSLCIDTFGCEKRISTDCRELIVTLYERPEEKKALCFLINGRSGAITSTLKIKANGKEHVLENVTVPAMSVLPIEL